MFSTPTCGWVELTIGSWSDRASYLTDIPNDVLDALVAYFQGLREYKWKPTCFKCDAEGWEYTIVFDEYDIYVITNKFALPELYSYEADIHEIALEVCNDISENVKEWAKWDTRLSFNDEGKDAQYEIAANEELLKEKLEVLRKLLDKNR